VLHHGISFSVSRKINFSPSGIVFTIINSVVNTIVRWSLMTKYLFFLNKLLKSLSSMIKQQESDDKSLEAEDDSKPLEMKLLNKNNTPNVIFFQGNPQFTVPSGSTSSPASRGEKRIILEKNWFNIKWSFNHSFCLTCSNYDPSFTSNLPFDFNSTFWKKNIFIAEDSFLYQTFTKTAKVIGRSTSSLLLISLGSLEK